MKRRTNAEIQEVERISDATRATASEISQRVNGDDERNETYVHVSGGRYWSVKAQYQKAHADDIDISFTTKDAQLAEDVARAIREVLLRRVQ